LISDVSIATIGPGRFGVVDWAANQARTEAFREAQDVVRFERTDDTALLDIPVIQAK